MIAIVIKSTSVSISFTFCHYYLLWVEFSSFLHVLFTSHSEPQTNDSKAGRQANKQTKREKENEKKRNEQEEISNSYFYRKRKGAPSDLVEREREHHIFLCKITERKSKSICQAQPEHASSFHTSIKPKPTNQQTKKREGVEGIGRGSHLQN